MTVLVGKPDEIVRGLPHPELGVLARCKFLPTVADVQEWMKPRIVFHYSQLKRDRAIAEQIADKRDEPTEEEKERVFKVWQKARDTLANKTAKVERSVLTESERKQLEEYISNPANP
ncbi:hypothetical protein FBQ96_12305 [Nitrospirales bacterium NOB]|nr:hypothetical protein [Nitrospirales bacterium NOB]